MTNFWDIKNIFPIKAPWQIIVPSLPHKNLKKQEEGGYNFLLQRLGYCNGKDPLFPVFPEQLLELVIIICRDMGKSWWGTGTSSWLLCPPWIPTYTCHSSTSHSQTNSTGTHFIYFVQSQLLMNLKNFFLWQFCEGTRVEIFHLNWSKIWAVWAVFERFI